MKKLFYYVFRTIPHIEPPVEGLTPTQNGAAQNNVFVQLVKLLEICGMVVKCPFVKFHDEVVAWPGVLESALGLGSRLSLAPLVRHWIWDNELELMEVVPVEPWLGRKFLGTQAATQQWVPKKQTLHRIVGIFAFKRTGFRERGQPTLLAPRRFLPRLTHLTPHGAAFGWASSYTAKRILDFPRLEITGCVRLDVCLYIIWPKPIFRQHTTRMVNPFMNASAARWAGFNFWDEILCHWILPTLPTSLDRHTFFAHI
jgi:hypothetical protein